MASARIWPPHDALDIDVCWPPSRLDLEPEACSCLPHGNELPCARCDKKPTELGEVSS